MIERMGRTTHPIYGRGVWVRYNTKEGTHKEFFPKDQFSHKLHPRYATGYTEDGQRSCIASSCSFYSELCRYGEFRWDEPK